MNHRALAAATAGAAIIALAGASPRASARTLDRASVVHLALAQNPQIAAAHAEEVAAAAQGRQVDAARFPIITLDAGVGPSTVATLVPGTAAQSTQQQYKNLRWSDLSAVWLGNLSVIQPLYTFGKIALRGEAATRGLRARQAQTRMQRADVAYSAAEIYEGYLFARDAERFFQEVDHWLDSTLQSTTDKLAQGVATVTERDVLRLQAAQGLAAMGLNQARAGKAAARAGLIAYLGLPPNEEITVADDEQTPVGALPVDPDSLVALAVSKRPELAALSEGKSALAALARAEAAGLWPDFFAMGFVSAAYTPGRDWIESRFIVDPLNHLVPGLLLGLRWQMQGGMALGARGGASRRAPTCWPTWANGPPPASRPRCASATRTPRAGRRTSRPDARP